MRVECVVCTFGNMFLGEALLRLETKEYFSESEYYSVTIPFDLNILLSRLIFKSDDLEIIIDISIMDTLRFIASIFSPIKLDLSKENLATHVIVRKNGIVVVNVHRMDYALEDIFGQIYFQDMRARKQLYGHECMRNSEIYINSISALMDLGGEMNYGTEKLDLARQLTLAKQGNHQSATALKGMGIARTKSAR